MKRFPPYCGQPGLEIIRTLFSPSNKSCNGVPWFDGGKTYFVHKARTGIRFIRELLGFEEGAEVLMPSYNCGSEVDALIASGFEVTLYRIDRSGKIDIDDLITRISSNTKVVYAIHYFGFPQPLEKLREVCDQRGLFLIEDCALSLFSISESGKIGNTGDISLFSLPKTLPVPDGGILQLNNPSICAKTWSLGKPRVWPVFRAFLPILKSTVVRAADDMLGPIPSKWFPAKWYLPSYSRDGVHDDRKFHDLPSSYYFDDALMNKAISTLTSRLLPSFDPEAIRNRRRGNFLAYLRHLDSVPEVVPLFPDLPPGVCPLWFPVLMNQPALMSHELIRHRIAAIPWWSGYHQLLPWENFPDACYLKEHVLALPVHQGIGETEVAFISRCFNELIEREALH